MKVIFPVVFIIKMLVLWGGMAGITGCQDSNTHLQISSPDKLTPEPASFYRYQYTQLHLGVQVRIVVFAEKEEKSRTAARAAFARIAALEDIFSNYRNHSELSRLSSNAYNKSVNVSPELFGVIQNSVLFSQETGGAFDITLGPLIDLWKNARVTETRPSSVSIEQAFKQAGWTRLIINEAAQTVLLQAPHMKLDMGGIAKGYILDEAIKVLAQSGITQALIEAGGDIVVSNAPPGKAGWIIEVPDALPGSAITQRASALENAAIATSGDTEQFVIIDGVHYSHVVDPQTGLGATSRIMATVIAPDGITADKFATALTVMAKGAADSLLAAHPEVTAFVRAANDVNYKPTNQKTLNSKSYLKP